MTSDLTRARTRLTDNQARVLAQLKAEYNMSESAILRFALSILCDQDGIEWPDDTPQHGGKREHKA